MSVPAKYTPSYSYSGFESVNPASPKPGAQLDNDFAQIQQSIGQTIDGLGDIRRSDGALANRVVGPDQLSDTLVIGFTLKGGWTTATAYKAGDGVTYGNTFYKANLSHTSAPGTRPDLDPITWAFLLTFSAIALTDGSVTPIKLDATAAAGFRNVIGQEETVAEGVANVTNKGVPVDADKLPLVDSENSGVLRGLTFSALTTWIGTKLGPVIGALTAKTAPIDGDAFAITDSAAGGASKKLLLSDLRTMMAAAAETLVNKTLTSPIINSPTVNTPTLVLKQSVGPVPTTEGDIQWDTDDDVVVIGDGSGQKRLVPIPASTAAGDLLYLSGALAAARLAKGTAGQALVMNAGATAPSWGSALTLGTPVTASGTAVNFTSIPAWVRRVTLSFSGISTNGTSDYLVQIGPSGGIETTGYLGTASYIQTDTGTGSSQFTVGLGILGINASYLMHGTVTLTLLDASANTWAMVGTLSLSGSNISLLSSSSKSMAGALNRIRVTTIGGANTFDAGSINVLYE